jgi:hypothetical protein
MSYLGAQPAPLATELDANTVTTADIQDGAVTAAKIASGVIPADVLTPSNTALLMQQQMLVKRQLLRLQLSIRSTGLLIPSPNGRSQQFLILLQR